MNRLQSRWAAVAVAALVVGWAGPGQAQEAGKRVGQKLDEVGREIKGGLNRAGSAAKDQFSRARASVHDMGVESWSTAGSTGTRRSMTP